MNLKLVTIFSPKFVKILFFQKRFQSEPSFSLWCCAYFPVLGRLKLDSLCHQTVAITSLYPCLLMQYSVRYCYFSLGSLPPSGRSAHQCCVMSYLAIWHLLIAFLGFVPYLPLASSALKTKLLIFLWLFILPSESFSDTL